MTDELLIRRWRDEENAAGVAIEASSIGIAEHRLDGGLSEQHLRVVEHRLPLTLQAGDRGIAAWRGADESGVVTVRAPPFAHRRHEQRRDAVFRRPREFEAFFQRYRTPI